MRILPVLIACDGCPEHGNLAAEVAACLERRGLAEASRAYGRWPVYSIDGCARYCARRWVEARGVRPARCFMLAGMERCDPEAIAAGLAAEV